jgi:hypothetical protein
LSPVLSYGGGSSLYSSLLSSVHVHAALGGDGPRWQPLNVADHHAQLARCQSESVLAGGNGNSSTKLWLDDNGARLLAVGWLLVAKARRIWLLTMLDYYVNYFVLTQLFVLYSLICINCLHNLPILQLFRTIQLNCIF